MIDIHKNDLVRDINMVAQVLARKSEEVAAQARRIEAAFAEDLGQHRNAVLRGVVEQIVEKVVGEVVHCSNVHTQSVARTSIRLTYALTAAEFAECQS